MRALTAAALILCALPGAAQTPATPSSSPPAEAQAPPAESQPPPPAEAQSLPADAQSPPAPAATRDDPDQRLLARADTYDVQWGGMTLGEGTISLTPLERGCFRYESTTEPMALVRWTYGSPREVSEFCMQDGRIVPQRFEYSNERRRKDNYTLDFDWRARTVKTIKGGNVSLRELPGRAYDRFLLQQVVRLWVIEQAGVDSPEPVEFTMVDDDRMKTYRFAIIGREQVSTPAGRYDAIRVERVDSPDKSSRFWVAPERGFVPVRIEHVEDGEVKLRMVVNS